jgi:hypothetical protein
MLLKAAISLAGPARPSSAMTSPTPITEAGTSSAPNAMVYALRTQESWAAETFANVARIAGMR